MADALSTFSGVADKTPIARDRFLRGVPAGDQQTRRLVESLYANRSEVPLGELRALLRRAVGGGNGVGEAHDARAAAQAPDSGAVGIAAGGSAAERHRVAAGASAVGRPLEPADARRISLVAVGDVQLGRGWPQATASLPPNQAADLFANVAPHLANADITFGNLETALADSGASAKCAPTSTRCYAFRAPTQFAETLARAGFDVMSVANNHAGDFGAPGRAATKAALLTHGIHQSGAVGDVASWEVNGAKVGLIAFATGGGMHRVQDIAEGKRLVSELKSRHDVVIVSFHAGAEGAQAARVPNGPERFFGEDRGNVRAFARGMVDAGADVLLGHGPHVLRGIERYKGRLIAYSLGNFSAWNSFNLRGPQGVSAILKLSVATNGVVTSAEIVPIVLEGPGIPKVDPAAGAVARLRELSEADFGDAFWDTSGRWSLKQ